MEENGVRFSCISYGWTNENGEYLGVICKPPRKTGYRKMFYLSDPIGNLTVMYDQEALGKYFAPELEKRVDYGLWLKMLREVDYCYGLNEVLAMYRIRNGSVSRDKKKLIRYQWRLYREIEKMPAWKSAFGILCWAAVKTVGIGTVKMGKSHVP